MRSDTYSSFLTGLLKVTAVKKSQQCCLKCLCFWELFRLEKTCPPKDTHHYGCWGYGLGEGKGEREEEEGRGGSEAEMGQEEENEEEEEAVAAAVMAH